MPGFDADVDPPSAGDRSHAGGEEFVDSGRFDLGGRVARSGIGGEGGADRRGGGVVGQEGCPAIPGALDRAGHRRCGAASRLERTVAGSGAVRRTPWAVASAAITSAVLVLESSTNHVALAPARGKRRRKGLGVLRRELRLGVPGGDDDDLAARRRLSWSRGGQGRSRTGTRRPAGGDRSRSASRGSGTREP